MVAENSSDWRSFGIIRHDLPNVADEPHVEHAVGLVQHEISTRSSRSCPCWIRSSKRPGVATRMSTPRCSAATCGRLADAAEDDGVAKAQMMAIGASAFADLRGEFAGRRQHEGTRCCAVRRRRGLPASCCRIGSSEGRGLAGAGLGNAQDILAGQQDGNRLGLNWGGREVAFSVQGTEQRLGDAEVAKCTVSQDIDGPYCTRMPAPGHEL